MGDEIRWTKNTVMRPYYRYFMGVYEYTSNVYQGKVSLFNSVDGLFVRSTVGNYIFVEEYEKGKIRPIRKEEPTT